MGKKLTQKEFIEKAELKHNHRYNYESTNYINARTKLEIICPTHGSFKQLAMHHLAGKGCPICGQEKLEAYRLKNKKSTLKFIEEANIIHSNNYDYTKTEYINAKTNVVVTCKLHGDFTVRPANHLQNKLGCTKCTHKGYSDTEWELLGNTSNNFDSFKLYIVKCFNETELFYKIGKTFTTISKRFNTFPYSWELICTIQDTAKKVSELERRLHKQNSEYSYTPVLKFAGNTECFQKLT